MKIEVMPPASEGPSPVFPRVKSFLHILREFCHNDALCYHYMLTIFLYLTFILKEKSIININFS